MMEMDMSFFDSNDTFKDVSAEDMMSFAHAALTFKKHKVINTVQVSLLFKLKLLAVNVVDWPWIREQPFVHIWFNEDGEIAVAELMKTMGVSDQDLCGMPDEFRDGIERGYTISKFLMHLTRLEREVSISAARSRDVVERYADWV